jgi:hypothetical protein
MCSGSRRGGVAGWVAGAGGIACGHESRTLVACALLVLVSGVAIAVHAASPSTPAAGRAGGVLKVLTREDLTQGFLIHESSTLSTIRPAQPCFNGLVTFDPMKPLESLDTVLPDLAEKWSWQDDYRSLVFFLRRGVRWHDGKPFTSRVAQQSQELDGKKRQALLARIQKKIEDDAEPGAPPHALQLRPHAGGVAGPIGPGSASAGHGHLRDDQAVVTSPPPPPASASAPRRRPRTRGARSLRASAPARSAA